MIEQIKFVVPGKKSFVILATLVKNVQAKLNILTLNNSKQEIGYSCEILITHQILRNEVSAQLLKSDITK